MKLYEIFYFGSYYYVSGKENLDLIKSNMKKLKAEYKRDHFALDRFMRANGIFCEKITAKPYKTLHRI